jgi:hypothetical protein
MTSWHDFEASNPSMAARGRQLLFRNGAGEALLTTVRGDQPPRTHPVNVGIVDGRLLTFVQDRSAKARDLEQDGRYALHALIDPTAPHEFLVRGHSTILTDAGLRERAIAEWPFTPGDHYPLVELAIDHALFGERGDRDAWPPVYTSWKPGATA